MRRVVGVACPLATAHVFPGSRRLHRRVPSSGEARPCTPPLCLEPKTSEGLQGKEEQHHGQARASTPPLCLKPEHAEDLKGKEPQQPIHADHEGKAERRAKRKQKRHGAQPGKTNLPKPNILAHNYYHCHKHTHCIVSPPTRNAKPVAAIGGDKKHEIS